MTSELNALNIENLIAGLMLASAVFSDLKIRRVRNLHILVMFALGVTVALTIHGFSSTSSIFSSVATALVLGLPLYLLKIFGGGDYKLLLAISPLFTWKAVALITATSLVWGALLGLIRTLLAGQAKVVLLNIFSLFSKQKLQPQQLHLIPFTVAIFFGFLTYLTCAQLGTWELL